MHRVRIVDGPNSHTGRVEVYGNSTGGVDDGEWGTICDDSWDIQNSRVVCRQVGYPDAASVPLSEKYGQGSGPAWLSYVWCTGDELDLLACVHTGIGYYKCEHDKYATAECSGSYP